MNSESNETTTGNGTSFASAPAIYVRRAAAANGILLLIGISVPVYVYLNFPHLSVIHDHTNNTSSETIESYLFKFLAAQVFLFAATAYPAIFWARFLRRAMRREAWLRENRPYLRGYYSDNLNKGVSTAFVLISAFFLCLTIYHSVLVALGKA